jgi:hypothetical protein
MELQTTDMEDLAHMMVGSENEVYMDETEEWVDGMYIRTLFIPKGVLLIGHKHKKDTINILSEGHLLVKTDMDEPWTELKAPFTGVTGPGVRKIGYAVEDCTFINIIRTDKTTSKETYDDIVEPEIASIVYHKYNPEGSHICQYYG